MRTGRSPGVSLALATLKWRSPASAISLGDRLRRAGDVDGARLAFQRAIDSGDVHGSPSGLWWMAALLRGTGDSDGAVEYFTRAVESGHPAWSTRAAVDLAELREKRGDIAGAAGLYEWAVNSGDPARSDGANVWSRRAATKLEILLAGHGEAERARAVYEQVTRGDREQQALFAVNRATELQERGYVDGAAASLREAIELDHPRVSPRAQTMLLLLQDP